MWKKINDTYSINLTTLQVIKTSTGKIMKPKVVNNHTYYLLMNKSYPLHELLYISKLNNGEIIYDDDTQPQYDSKFINIFDNPTNLDKIIGKYENMVSVVDYDTVTLLWFGKWETTEHLSYILIKTLEQKLYQPLDLFYPSEQKLYRKVVGEFKQYLIIKPQIEDKYVNRWLK